MNDTNVKTSTRGYENRSSKYTMKNGFRRCPDKRKICATWRNKISPFEAHMGRKPNTPLCNLATINSPCDLNWEKAKHACKDQKNLTQPPLAAEIMHDLQQWLEDEVSINQRQQLQLQPIGADKTTKPTSGVKRRRIVAIKIDKINNRYKEYNHPPTKTLAND